MSIIEKHGNMAIEQLSNGTYVVWKNCIALKTTRYFGVACKWYVNALLGLV